jgi:hypothetical protein
MLRPSARAILATNEDGAPADSWWGARARLRLDEVFELRHSLQGGLDEPPCLGSIPVGRDPRCSSGRTSLLKIDKGRFGRRKDGSRRER